MPPEISKAALELLARLEALEASAGSKTVKEVDGIRHELLASFLGGWAGLSGEDAALAADRLGNAMYELGWSDEPDKVWRRDMIASFLLTVLEGDFLRD